MNKSNTDLMALYASRYELILAMFNCTDLDTLDRLMGLFHPSAALEGWAQKQVYKEKNISIKRHMIIDFINHGVYDELDWHWVLGSKDD